MCHQASVGLCGDQQGEKERVVFHAGLQVPFVFVWPLASGFAAAAPLSKLSTRFEPMLVHDAPAASSQSTTDEGPLR